MLMTMIIQAVMYDDDTPLEYLMRTPVWGLCMILCMHRFCLDKRKENFYRSCICCYVWDSTGLQEVCRLATGPGGLKPIWILAPVTGRISGSLQARRDSQAIQPLICW